MKRIMKQILIPVVLALLAYLFLMVSGKTCTVEIDPARFGLTAEEAAECTVVMDPEGIVSLDAQEVKDGILTLKFSSLSEGKSFADVMYHGDHCAYYALYVHPGKVITFGEYFGKCQGDLIIPVAICLYLLYAISVRIKVYQAEKKKTLYSYRNVRNLGLILALIFLLISQALTLIDYGGFIHTLNSFLHIFGWMVWTALPIVFLTSLYITRSNFELLRKEGRSWRNMLGMILGILLMTGSLLSLFLGDYFQRVTYIDVHNERGIWLYLTEYLIAVIAILVAYLETILIGTIIYGLKAARSVPDFDRDYILILGCGIMPDGSLTKLLQGRADRALEFAAMQKEKTGKDIIFVPSGGQGGNEPVSEGEAIANYLRSKGIDEDHILVENTSVNTYENFRNSMELIREQGLYEDPKIAFSTTNYHVFRSGVIAHDQGIEAQGIGSKTKAYFWINAFIREFIAELAAEKHLHLLISGGILLITGILVYLIRFNGIQ